MEKNTRRGFVIYRSLSKKSQIQMMENIGILVVFFFLLIFGLIFYVSLQKANIEVKGDKAKDLGALSVSQRVLYMPELVCSKGFNVIDNYCFDLAKMGVFSELMSGNTLLRDTLYYDYFGDSLITVEEILPGTLIPKKVGTNKREMVLYNRSIKGAESQTMLLPINIKDPTNPAHEEYGIGLLKIQVYAK